MYHARILRVQTITVQLVSHAIILRVIFGTAQLVRKIVIIQLATTGTVLLVLNAVIVEIGIVLWFIHHVITLRVLTTTVQLV